MIRNNLIIIILGAVILVSGIFTLSANKGFGYSLIVFGVIIELITIIKILYEKGKL
jgi:hypothetical protein